jgi:hypothetical protein
MSVIKFPYKACRRVHSRKTRNSKNGAPEERAAKAAAAQSSSATITRISGQTRAADEGSTLVEFIQSLRAYVVREFARGKDVDRIFGELEDSYRQLEKVLRDRKGGRTDPRPHGRVRNYLSTIMGYSGLHGDPT